MAVQFRMSAILRDEARKVLEGITTIEEVFRVTRMYLILKLPHRNNLLTYPVK